MEADDVASKLLGVGATDDVHELCDRAHRRVECKPEQMQPDLARLSADVGDREPQCGRAGGKVAGKPARALGCAFARERRQADQQLEGRIRALIKLEAR